MNEKVLKTLEYDKITKRLEEYAYSDYAKSLCRSLMPSSDIEEIQYQQAQTSDAYRRIMQKGSISFSGIRDIRASFQRLKVGSVLGMGELLSVSSLLN